MDTKIATALRSLDRVRGATFRLTSPLGHDDLHRQFSNIMSPLVWDIGHVGNFEEFWLLRELHGRTAYDRALDEVYNPFDNPRPIRAELPILGFEDASRYLFEVRDEVHMSAGKAASDPSNPLLADAYVYNMIIQHEAQHQETMLAALNIRADLRSYPLLETSQVRAVRPHDERRSFVDAGVYLAGTDDRIWAYDNERPQHPVFVEGFWMDTFPVSNRRFSRFVESGGYQNLDFWSPEGRAWLAETGEQVPQGWLKATDGGWLVRRFGHILPLDPAEPVQHVSFFEAEAFAEFSGARLPTEFEWEKACGWDPAASQIRKYPWGDQYAPGRSNLGTRRLGPARVGSYPTGASAFGVQQLLGETYEWTSSKFSAYPGFSTFPYPEYSEVFFDQNYAVLRGASHATSPYVGRTTFRNWDLPERRQIFSGIRLAWDLAS